MMRCRKIVWENAEKFSTRPTSPDLTKGRNIQIFRQCFLNGFINFQHPLQMHCSFLASFLICFPLKYRMKIKLHEGNFRTKRTIFDYSISLQLTKMEQLIFYRLNIKERDKSVNIFTFYVFIMVKGNCFEAKSHIKRLKLKYPKITFHINIISLHKSEDI